MIHAMRACGRVLCIGMPFLSCAHRVDLHDAAVAFASADLRALVDSLGEEQALEYLLELRLRDCVRDCQAWYSGWPSEASAIVIGARYPVTFVSYEVRALYWAYVIYHRRLCRGKDLGVIVDARYGRPMYNVVVSAADEPKLSDRCTFVSVAACPIHTDASKWDPAIDTWCGDWLAELRTVGLDSLRRMGSSPLHPAYIFLAYTRPTHLPSIRSECTGRESERKDLEMECA